MVLSQRCTGIYLSYHGTANRSTADRDTVKREVNPVGTDLDETVRGRERKREGRVELVDTFAPRLPPL